MRISSRKGWLACGVWIMMLCLVLQSRGADETVSTGSADDLQSALDEVVAAGGGTIQVTAPILIGDTNGTADLGFDGVSNVVLSASSNTLFIVGDGSSLSLSNMALVDGVGTNGGAVYISSGGTATFTNCFFSNNVALGIGGFSPGATNGSTTNVIPHGQRGGAGTAGLGGAIFNLGTVSVLNCTFATNSAIGGGGGDGADGGSGVTRGGTGGNGGPGGAALGGGIYTAGPVTIVNTTFSNNVAQGGTGGTAGAGGSALISGVSGAGGFGGNAGGAGLYSTSTNAAVLILSSTFANNFAQGGASQTGGTGSAGLGQSGRTGGIALGGGIENDKGSSTILTNCTFFQNEAIGGGGGNGGDGGGRGGNGGNGGNAIGGGIYNLGTVAVVNCTFAQGGAFGGTNGVAGSGAASARDGRRGTSRGGNVANAANRKKGSFTLANSIIATNLSGGGGFGTFIDGGYNVSADRSIAFKSARKGGTSLSRTDPQVGELGQNGGPTETVPITSSNSPAVNFIKANDFPPVDQRGVSRPQLTFPDAGAFELNPDELVIVTQPQSTNVPVGSNAVFSVTVSGPSPNYQWYFAASNVVVDPSDLLAGQTSTNVVLTDVQLTNAGQFLVVITNDFSAVTSHVATLTVGVTNSAPVITSLTPFGSSTSPLSVQLGTNVVISVTVTGTPPFTYQWFFQNSSFMTTNLVDGGNISGSTSNILTISNFQATNVGNYAVTVTNSLGSASTNLTIITNSTSGDGGNPNPSPTGLRFKSNGNVRRASLQPSGAHAATTGERTTAVLYLRRGQESQRDGETPISPEALRVPGAFDDARPWAVWRGARPPDKTFPYCRRSFRAAA